MDDDSIPSASLYSHYLRHNVLWALIHTEHSYPKFLKCLSTLLGGSTVVLSTGCGARPPEHESRL